MNTHRRQKAITAAQRRQQRPAHVQMDLPFHPPGTLHHALSSYLAHQSDGLATETISDYRDRITWLNRVFGESCPLTQITYLRLERVAREYGIGSGRTGILDVTIRKRFTYLRAALKYAVLCGYLHRDAIPELPRLKDDGLPRRSYHTVAQWRDFREALRPGSMRRFADLGFWTGHHTHDLESTTWEMLDPERPIVNADGEIVGTGMFLRRNHKNRKCMDVWFPMEPEFRTIVQAWYADGQATAPGALVCGRMWSKQQAFAAAADRAGVPRVSPIDLRRSYATMLVGRGYSHEYVRQALGHEGETSLTSGGESANPTTLSRHYLVAGPALWSGWAKLHGTTANDNAAK